MRADIHLQDMLFIREEKNVCALSEVAKSLILTSTENDEKDRCYILRYFKIFLFSSLIIK